MPKQFAKISPVDEFNEVAELSLVYRNKGKASDRPIVRISDDAYNIFLKTWDKDKIELLEEFKILLLNSRNSCLGISNICSGGTSRCYVDLKLVFATALLGNASSIILAHNHPTGNLKPSVPDIRLTQKFVEVGSQFEIPVIDHLIVSKEGYYSLMDERVVFNRSNDPLPF
ncbi:JAB domain-containing protein [Ferruginibacter albus]|uniref:JAB domain-containing protein n=1 Tax=Ferruginibacter albus TaxID=2875540 RepID=UPI001CC431E7|nr:JAB domain-containing protein [Ferruginibacter albus]UAY53192.1 JAB domain-containing protein [Ferruginibacter albus]